MLKELKIENLAIIDKLDLEFQKGFIALTGETGAGKSIILSGINLLIGDKGSVDMIRDGAENLLAQGIFNISEEQLKEIKKLGLLVEDKEIIVTRVLERTGKGKAFINGIRVPMESLKEIMSQLVDIVGQHSHQMLLQKSNHIKLLDKFLSHEEQKIKKEIKEKYYIHENMKERIETLKKEQQEIANKKDFFIFQLEEIGILNLKKDEDIELEEDYKKLFNGGKIKEKLRGAFNSLKKGENSSLNLLNSSRKNIESLGKYGEEYQEVSERLEKIYYELDDVADIISTLDDSLETDDRKLEEVISRIDKINKLKLKYGSTVVEIIEYKDKIQEQLNFLEDGNYEIEILEKERDKFYNEIVKLCEKLRGYRKEIGQRIEKRLKEELSLLNMKEAQLQIKFTQIRHLTDEGMDGVEFYISTNLGQELKPLAKIASGGEISRIMLGLKVIFSKVDNLSMILFDEIDSGVGGESVKRIGEKLKEIGENSQVISITHSPAIAAKANQQLYIEKKNIDGRTVSTVRTLSNNERIEEIARMIAGENPSNVVLEHAKELLDGNRQ